MVRKMRIFPVTPEVDEEVNEFLMNLADRRVRKATVDLQYVVSQTEPKGKYEVTVLYRSPVHRSV